MMIELQAEISNNSDNLYDNLRPTVAGIGLCPRNRPVYPAKAIGGLPILNIPSHDRSTFGAETRDFQGNVKHVLIHRCSTLATGEFGETIELMSQVLSPTHSPNS